MIYKTKYSLKNQNANDIFRWVDHWIQKNKYIHILFKLPVGCCCGIRDIINTANIDGT